MGKMVFTFEKDFDTMIEYVLASLDASYKGDDIVYVNSWRDFENKTYTFTDEKSEDFDFYNVINFLCATLNSENKNYSFKAEYTDDFNEITINANLNDNTFYVEKDENGFEKDFECDLIDGIFEEEDEENLFEFLFNIIDKEDFEDFE